MDQSWEQKFREWAKPPVQAEQDRCENAERAIRNAIARSDKLRHRSVRVFPQGSYKNNTNVRRDSDVDIGIVCEDIFFADYPEGTSRETFGNSKADYSNQQFKKDVGEALVAYFDAGVVTRGNKAFDIKA